jgi:hypothetical protein
MDSIFHFLNKNMYEEQRIKITYVGFFAF